MRGSSLSLDIRISLGDGRVRERRDQAINLIAPPSV